MLAVELVTGGGSEPDPAPARDVSAAVHRQGVIVLTCGTYGNVLRFLPPPTIGEKLLNDGLDILESALARLAVSA